MDYFSCWFIALVFAPCLFPSALDPASAYVHNLLLAGSQYWDYAWIEKYLIQTMDICSQALHLQEKISYFKYRNNHYKSLSNLETEKKIAHFSDLTIP